MSQNAMEKYESIPNEGDGKELENGGKKKYVSVFYHQVTPASLDMQTTEKTEKTFLVNPGNPPTVQEYVPDYLPLSILSVMLFFPFGIPAVVYSCKVRSALRRRDTDRARHFSRWAMQLGLISILTGPFLAGLIVITFIFVKHTT